MTETRTLAGLFGCWAIMVTWMIICHVAEARARARARQSRRTS